MLRMLVAITGFLPVISAAAVGSNINVYAFCGQNKGQNLVYCTRKDYMLAKACCDGVETPDTPHTPDGGVYLVGEEKLGVCGCCYTSRKMSTTLYSPDVAEMWNVTGTMLYVRRSLSLRPSHLHPSRLSMLVRFKGRCFV